MKKHYKTIKWILQVLVTVFLLYITLQQLEITKLKEILSSIKVLPLLLVPVFLVIDMIISSFRLLSLYRLYGIKTNLLKICWIKLQGFFFSLLFPLLGDAYKVQSFKTLYGSSYGKNSVVVLLDRLIYTFGLTIILLPVWVLGVIQLNYIFKIIIVSLLFIELIILYLLNKPDIVKNILNQLGKLHKKFLAIPVNFEHRKAFNIEITINTLIAILRHTLIALLYLTVTYAVLHTIDFNVLMFVLIVFSIMISRVIPVSVGGIGLREYIAVMILPQIGIATEYAFTIAFIMSSVMILQGMAGGISFLVNRLTNINKSLINT